MRVAIYSGSFAPSIGGQERFVQNLADSLSSRGHDIRLVTRTPAVLPDGFRFQVIRQPTIREFYGVVNWSDAVVMASVSMSACWPLFFTKRPLVISHQTHVRTWRSGTFRALVQRKVLSKSCNVAISSAVAATLGRSSHVIPNCYDDVLFRTTFAGRRDRDLAFVGRLVSDKGADVLIRALGILAAVDLRPRLSIVGMGPEEPALRRLSDDVGVGNQITFVGALGGEPLVQLLNHHRILVVPSTWHEPFGIVALEGIACGCVVVGSRGGGLPEAIGPCGTLFENGNAADLARALSALLKHPGEMERCLRNSPAHLNAFKKAVVARRYEALIEECLHR